MKVPALRLGINPIIVKELRSRMRGWRSFGTLTAILLLLGLVSWGLYQMVLVTSRYSSTPLSPMIGQTLFAGLAFMELLMVCGITPAVTAGAISGEQEKLTYEMLLTTPLKPASILWGKLVSSLSFVFLLIFAAVPMASLVFIFGGVAPRDMIKSIVVLVVVALMLGMLGLFMSALFGRSGRATVLSYLVVVILLFGPIFLTVMVGILEQTDPPRWLLVPSPLAALASALAPSMGGDNQIFYLLGGSFWRLTGNTFSQTGIPRPLYHYSLPFYGLLTLLFYLGSMRLVLPTRRWRVRRREALIGLAVVVIFCGLVGAGFYGTAGRYENFMNIFRSQNPNPMDRPDMMPAVPMPEVVVEKRVVAVEAPTATPLPPPTPTPDGVSAGSSEEASMEIVPEDMAGIYTAAIRQLITVDHTFNDMPDALALYLVWTTDDSIGDPDSQKSDPVEIPAEIREQIDAGLAGLPAKILWVSTFDDVPQESQNERLAPSTAVVTLGNIHEQDDWTVQVPASIYFGNLAAGGQTYVLEKVDGTWTVTGNTGVEWIS